MRNSVGRANDPPHTSFRVEQAAPDSCILVGDIDVLIIVPQVLGVGMAKKRVMFLIRKHSPVPVVGELAGSTMTNQQTQSQGQPPANAESGGDIALTDGPTKDAIPSDFEMFELTRFDTVDCVCCGGTP